MIDLPLTDAQLRAMADRRQRAHALKLPLDTSIEEIERRESLRAPKTLDLMAAVKSSLRGESDEEIRAAASIQPDVIEAPPLPREKQVEREGDKLMQRAGFTVIRLSQRRPSKVTVGLPDRLYMHPGRQLVVWWEAKSASGKQRPAQERFQALCVACGVAYVLGGVGNLRDWLTRKLEAR